MAECWHRTAGTIHCWVQGILQKTIYVCIQFLFVLYIYTYIYTHPCLRACVYLEGSGRRHQKVFPVLSHLWGVGSRGGSKGENSLVILRISRLFKKFVYCVHVICISNKQQKQRSCWMEEGMQRAEWGRSGSWLTPSTTPPRGLPGPAKQFCSAAVLRTSTAFLHP